MSKVYAMKSGFVGFQGQSVWLGEGDEYDDSNALVKAMPDFFTSKAAPSVAVAEEKVRRRTGGGRG